MASVFTQIRNNIIPGVIFADNNEFFVIHNKLPSRLGHLLVIPYEEYSYIFELDDEVYQRLWVYAKEIAHRLQMITRAPRIGIRVEGLEVNHLHIHLIPIWQAGDMDDVSDISLDDIHALQTQFINI
jgi:histidine triad (HIT) family protein